MADVTFLDLDPQDTDSALILKQKLIACIRACTTAVAGISGGGAPTIETLTDAATVTPDSDANDGGILTTLSQATLIANPTGTPDNLQKYTLRIKSTAARALTWGNQFRFSTDIPDPATTSGASLTDYLVFLRNTADSKWDCVGKTFGF